MKALVMIVLVCLLPIGIIEAQEEEILSSAVNEVSFGVGGLYSFEKSMFNVESDVEAGTNLGINLSYFYNINERWAIGIGMYGFVTVVDNLWIWSSSRGLGNHSLNVSVLNVAAEGKYYWMRGGVEPYCVALLAYSGGTLQNDELGTLNLNGISAGAGAGVAFPVGGSWVLSFEGLASLGSAKWKEKPFYNSSGTDFNPSMIALFAQVGYRF